MEILLIKELVASLREIDGKVVEIGCARRRRGESDCDLSETDDSFIVFVR
jgi:hypothetical protein